MRAAPPVPNPTENAPLVIRLVIRLLLVHVGLVRVVIVLVPVCCGTVRYVFRLQEETNVSKMTAEAMCPLS